MGTLKQLTDKQGNNIYPITHATGVIYEGGILDNTIKNIYNIINNGSTGGGGSAGTINAGSNILTSDPTWVTSSTSGNTNTYLNHVANNSVVSSLQIKGGDATAVKSESNVLTITTPSAAGTQLGAIKVHSTSDYTVNAQTNTLLSNITTNNQHYYGVLLDGNKRAFVYVPWSNENNNYKTKLALINNPTGNKYNNSISFIQTITQNANGEITAERGTVREASKTTSGIITTGNLTFGGNKAFDGTLTLNSELLFYKQYASTINISYVDQQRFCELYIQQTAVESHEDDYWLQVNVDGTIKATDSLFASKIKLDHPTYVIASPTINTTDIEPNKVMYYTINEDNEGVVFNLLEDEIYNDRVPIYSIIVKTKKNNSSILFDQNIIWSNGTMPTLKTNEMLEVNIMEISEQLFGIWIKYEV